jgi:hypothetical protein
MRLTRDNRRVIMEQFRFFSAMPVSGSFGDLWSSRTLKLAGLFSAGVICWFYILRETGVFAGNWVASPGRFFSDALLVFLLAFPAVAFGQRLSQRWRIGSQSVSGLFVRSGLIAGIFALFLLATSWPHQILQRAYSAAPTHVFHGQSRTAVSGEPEGITAAGLRGLQEALLGYVVALPLMFLGLAVLSGTNNDIQTNADDPDRGSQALAVRSVILTAIVLATAMAGVAGLSLIYAPQIHSAPRGFPDHAPMVTNIPVGDGFDINDVRVTVRSAQWVRQPRAGDLSTYGAASVRAGNPDRIYLEVTLENIAASSRNVGRGEFGLRAPNGRSWAPLADDFPDILLAPSETLTTRFIFELPPQASQLQLVPMGGAGEMHIPIGDDAVGGLFGALCRALSKPWAG